jgi:hypothetical protein
MVPVRDSGYPVAILKRMILMVLQLTLFAYERKRTDSRWKVFTARKMATAA